MAYRDERKRSRDREARRRHDDERPRRREDDRRESRREDDRRESRREEDRRETRRDDRRRDDSRRRGDERPRDDHRRRMEDRDDRRKRERSRSHQSGKGSKPSNGPPVRNLRIDRHECRKAAIEFLIDNPNVTDKYSNDEIGDMIVDFIRTLGRDFDYYSFTTEILRGLLIDRKYTVITDRWVMGILDEHLQGELRLPDLSILRVAGYELLTHPEIPTTVVINEVNVLSKMYCPEKQALIHAAVNRMIETQTSIGNELAIESGARRKRKDDPMNLLAGLDQESQLALILLEQIRKKKRRERNRSRSRSSSTSSSSSSYASRRRSPSPKRSRPESPEEPTPESFEHEAVKRADQGGIKIKYTATFDAPAKAIVESEEKEKPTSVNASTQTVKNPLLEPGVRIYRIRIAM